jgi:hypothetical protein
MKGMELRPLVFALAPETACRPFPFHYFWLYVNMTDDNFRTKVPAH